MNNIVLSVADIQLVERVETINHLKLAENLGYSLHENAKNFLVFVDALTLRDPGFQDLGIVAASSETIRQERNGTEYQRRLLRFTEEQALYVTAKSHKPQAAALTLAMVKVFAAYRAGNLEPRFFDRSPFMDMMMAHHDAHVEVISRLERLELAAGGNQLDLKRIIDTLEGQTSPAPTAKADPRPNAVRAKPPVPGKPVELLAVSHLGLSKYRAGRVQQRLVSLELQERGPGGSNYRITPAGTRIGARTRKSEAGYSYIGWPKSILDAIVQHLLN